MLTLTIFKRFSTTFLENYAFAKAMKVFTIGYGCLCLFCTVMTGIVLLLRDLVMFDLEMLPESDHPVFLLVYLFHWIQINEFFRRFKSAVEVLEVTVLR